MSPDVIDKCIRMQRRAASLHKTWRQYPEVFPKAGQWAGEIYAQERALRLGNSDE